MATNGSPSNDRKVALITGITGQDGSYLAEFLIDKGYTVHGIMRRASTFNTGRIQHLYKDPKTHQSGSMVLHYGDLTDSTCLVKIVSKVRPSEIYNLGAQSHVKVSFEMGEYSADVDGLGTLRLLDAIRTCGLDDFMCPWLHGPCKACYFSSFFLNLKIFCLFVYSLVTYAGAAKLYAYWITINFREAYNMFACNGILFNHESPRRGETFVTRKITRAVAKIHLGQQDSVSLGNIDSQRDWGHAKDYIEAMWMMLQHKEPVDLVIATNQVHSVREFVVASFKCIGVEIVWEGKGEQEVGKDKATGVIRVKIDPKFYRPTEVEYLQGDPSKAEKLLGWKPKCSFDELVKEMVESDINVMKKNPTA
eukprot:XP_011679327.1 PREDICTED: GDP-mannose 4,6 dehydratase [Strongylocentrotus purpuratus]